MSRLHFFFLNEVKSTLTLLDLRHSHPAALWWVQENSPEPEDLEGHHMGLLGSLCDLF